MPFPILHRTRWVQAPLLGLVATLGYAPYGQWYLSLLALALLLALAARATPGRALLLGWLYGLAHFLSGIYWVYISTHVYGGAPAWLGALLTFALAAYLALYPALVLGLSVRLGLLQAPAGWLGVPALWVLMELVRGRVVFSGMPWLSLGELGVDTPLARLAPLLGVHGMSVVIALAAFALYRLGVEHDARRRAFAAAVLAAPLATLLLPRPSAWTEPDGAAVPVALVQSNIRQDEKWQPAMRFEALARHWRLTQQAWPAVLVVWPEVALTQPYHQLKDGFLADLDRQAAARGATVLVGILVFEGEAHYNSLVSLGAAHGRYDKRHLVPFGEYFPIPAFLRPIMDVLETPYSDFAFGAADQPLLRVDGHAVEVSICFEDVFGDEIRRRARDAAYLVNVTNDAWFADSSAPHQHLQFSRLRAMENGRWMLRAANTGISALIDPDGTIVARARQFEMEVVRGEVEPRRGLTPYQRWGDVPLWLGATALLLGAALWQRRQHKGDGLKSVPPPMKIRPATDADLPGIFAIYDHEVLHGTATFDTRPKADAERLEWFRNDGDGRYPILLAEADGHVVGWARLYAWSPRQAYDRTAENAVYVHRAHRGQGLSRALMEELMRLAPQRGVQVLIARIVEGNPASLALHEKLGFRTIGVMQRVGEKFGRLLDVRLLDRHLDR